MRLKQLAPRLLVAFFLVSCAPTPQPPTQTAFYLYRFDPPAFVEFTADFQEKKAIPFSVPPDCGLLDVYSAWIGKYLLIELNCPNGTTVVFLDTDSGSVARPVTDTDSHFLAWAQDGNSAYLKIDSLGTARIVRASADQKAFIPITEFTYDLAPDPTGSDFTFTFSRGMGQGSELWLARREGKVVQQLYADPFNYISFARYSPDGKQIAFLKIPDSPVPFTVGELWTMDADGSRPRQLAAADAGHGYAANWSPDGTRIAFVKRENAADESANQSAESLISNIYIVDVQSGKATQLTRFTDGRVETPHWSTDGSTLAFNRVLNGRMDVQIADIKSGRLRSLTNGSAPTEGSTCCPAWIQK